MWDWMRGGGRPGAWDGLPYSTKTIRKRARHRGIRGAEGAGKGSPFAGVFASRGGPVSHGLFASRGERLRRSPLFARCSERVAILPHVDAEPETSLACRCRTDEEVRVAVVVMDAHGVEHGDAAVDQREVGLR